MKLKYQRTLYLTFFAVFFVVAPILALYTAGYRYDSKKGQLEKIGVLSVDSLPKDAGVFINGKYQSQTPIDIIKLLPGRYNIEIRKDDYYPWAKEIEIKSNAAAFYNDVILFKKKLPELKIEGQINIFSASTDGKKIIYSIVRENKEELRLLNINNNSDFLIEEFNSTTYNSLSFVEWSPTNTKALIRQAIGNFNKYLIVDTETLKSKELFNITRLNFSKITWDRQNDFYLYGLQKTILYKIDLINNLTETVISANITDFQIINSNIYYITRSANDYFLNRKRLTTEELKDKKIKLLPFSDYSLKFADLKILVLLDNKNNDLFIVNSKIFDSESIENEIILQANAKNIFWSADKNNLIYYDNAELWTYNFDKNENKLINRYGEIIDNPIWYPKNNYIIYQMENKIKIIEVGGKNYKNNITLAKLEEIKNLGIDQMGKILYFSGKIGNQEGIFQLELQ